MEQVIQALTTALSVPVVPLSANNVDDCVIYRFYSTLDNGAVKQIRLELRLNTHTIAASEDIKKTICQTLVTVGDEGKNGYNSCQVNGGGQLRDEETGLITTIMYFTIITKSEVTYYGD